MTEQHPYRARPLHVSVPHQLSQECFGRIWRIGARHGIAAEPKAVRRARSHQAMQKKPAVTPRQHDLSGTNLFRRAAFDLDHLTRPKSGQHAFSVNAQMQTTTSTQSVRH
jgi:hypothetical protein